MEGETSYSSMHIDGEYQGGGRNEHTRYVADKMGRVPVQVAVPA